MRSDEVPLERPAACGAVFASVENNLQVKLVPPLLGKEFFGVPFGLLHAFAAGQLPTGHQPVNVRVYRKSWNAEGLAHDHRRRFVSNPWHGLKSLKRGRNLSSVKRHDHLRQSLEAFRLHRNQSAGPDDLGNFVNAQGGHGLGRVGLGKQRWGDGVHPRVGALRRQHYGAEQGEGAVVVERNGRFRVQRLQGVYEVGGFLLLGHQTKV